jgi:HSP20 family protein
MLIEAQNKRRIEMIGFHYGPAMARFFERSTSNSRPDVDIIENADNYLFSFEIPGAMKDDVKIWLEDDLLTISGEKKEELAEGETKLLSGRSFGKFEMSFRLPGSIDGGKIKAEFVDGLLVVTVPRSEKAKPKEIAIQG